MDGSDHPKPSDASTSNADAPSAPTATPSTGNSQTNHDEQRGATKSGLKRRHEDDENDDVGEKRQLSDSDDDDDLDLDALMARSQQHTESHKDNAVSPEEVESTSSQPQEPHTEAALTEEPHAEESHAEETHSEDMHETEMSIAAQLRGALSSLQDMDSDSEINSDELTQMLRHPEDKLSEEKVADEGKGETEKADTEKVPDEKSGTGRPEQSEVAHQEQQDQHPAKDQEQHQHQGAERVRELSATGAEGKRSSPTEDESQMPRSASDKKREASISQMPPPPAHLRGSSPPMPPPPPAFTSPVASYTASELVSSKSAQPVPPVKRATASTAPVASSIPTANSSYTTAKPSGESASRFPEPTFSELSAVSEKYGSASADQIDGVFKEKPDEAPSQPENQTTSASPLNYVALHLNENKAILQARKRSILLLDSLACQVLDSSSFNHYQDTSATVMQPESDRGISYRILLDTFEDLKRVYCKWETPSSRKHAVPKSPEVRPFLTYDIPGVEDSRDNSTTIQRVNLATFVAAIFGSIEIGFYELNDWFIKVFVQENGRLLKQQGNIYLDLKTQAYISALETTEDSVAQQAALDHSFPKDLENQMRDMFGDRVTLAPTEKDFVAKCHRRKENIKSENVKDLPMKYHWVPFLRDVSEYISRNHYTLLPQRKHSIVPTELSVHPPVTTTTTVRSYPGSRRQAPAASSRSTVSGEREQSLPTVRTSASPPAARTPTSHTPSRTPSAPVNSTAEVEVSSVAPAAKPVSSDENSMRLKMEFQEIFTGNNQKSRSKEASPAATSSGGPSEVETPGNSAKAAPDGNAVSVEKNPTAHQQKHPSIPLEGHPSFPPSPKQVSPRPSPVTSASSETSEKDRVRRPGPRPHIDAAANLVAGSSNTLAVYEAARASAEGTDLVRPKVSLYTTRRTWTKEEEEASSKGMDRVQGPYWAQILELYGPGGKINEVLKDRTQVQLKDKARNLKMFFVRLGLPIPAVFQYVTGDYETRKSSSKRVRDKRQSKAAPLPNQPQSQQQNQTVQHQPPQQQAPHPPQPQQPQPQPQQQSQPQRLLHQESQQAVTLSTSTQISLQSSDLAENGAQAATNARDTAVSGFGSASTSPIANPMNATDSSSTHAATGGSSKENLGEISNRGSENKENNTDLLPDASEDDKAKEVEEDSSSLLDRVGEYVDSH